MTLPITLILPTRNAMGVIESHVHALADVLPCVAQIVAVDSSEDGTLDYLRNRIDLPTAEFHSRPRGLYEGWNFGARQATAEFVYYSTVGDTITLAGLEHLLEVAKRHAADITISPPDMFDDQGEPLPDRRWPIHDLCAQMGEDRERKLTPTEAFILSASYVPSTILGSSASNLYRSSFLTAHPFLENWGHCADSPWIMANCLAGTVAVTSRRVAKFVIHAKEPVTNASHVIGLSHYEDMYRSAYEGVRASGLPELEQAALSGWLIALERRDRQLLERIEANVGYLARRDEKIAILNERVTKARQRTADVEAQLKQSNEKVVDLRRTIGQYERAHRSLVAMISLYSSVKFDQMKKLWALVLGKP
jgi:hypothetical protein